MKMLDGTRFRCPSPAEEAKQRNGEILSTAGDLL